MWQGTVESLHIVAEKSQPMTTVETIHAISGRGLEGDRYANGKGTYSNKLEEGRQVTLFEQETLEALHRDHGIALEPRETRRNVITRGVPLNHLVGQRFLVSDVLLEGMRLNKPCRDRCPWAIIARLSPTTATSTPAISAHCADV